jgi:F-box-like
MLPDDILLDVFSFYVDEAPIEAWQSLVHVCRRWRSIVFGSPRRLDLRLVCSDKTKARDTLGVWPPLLLLIYCQEIRESADDIVALLECSDRVCYIDLTVLESLELSAAVQVPFPELTFLVLRSNGKTVSALPDSFLVGSAPRLEFLILHSIPFLGLPKLLLSATHLVTLELDNIPHSGYFPPEAIVTALSTLTRLEDLWLYFESSQSRPDPAHQRPPPPTRSVLPNLEGFHFKGDSEYVEVIVAHINTPRLRCLETTLFNDIVYDTLHLTQFISRTLRVKALEKAHVSFDGAAARVELSSLISGKYEETQGGNPMQRVGLASLVYGAGLSFMLTSPPHFRPPHLRESPLSTTLASKPRKCAMAATITPFHIHEKPLPIRGDCATYRSCPARARWGQSDRSVARPREYFLGGGSAIGTCPGGHSAGRCCATGHQSPYSSFLPTEASVPSSQRSWFYRHGHPSPTTVIVLVAEPPSHFRRFFLIPFALSMCPSAALPMGRHPAIPPVTIPEFPC